ncbi:dienelactone hydrolase family protein [Phycisphaera mikurensis]|uniref:Dienelactone hydrolase domain-containing protein n=1 Tax=Phycisphaera mikurensis (strain NBRC 102666 / KCTC 22515 / FYK2301M01) TaxID=1142394 RepID=I0IBA2_PHYMF|nr:dienelactone hydrolase family protein [Phycisphaera mikurensis]MBB6443035.1 dienelactone hydrolase [Phycisphaera mikurensis]BAM02540.1 hypothetical protein PSMK_03810 [Phycisphaera mikurensis NBRC 102666]
MSPNLLRRLARPALPAVATWIAALSASAELQRVDVAYENPGGVAATGLLVYDDALTAADEASPGVLVVPEWWGMTAFPVEQAERLAAAGRVAFVADMYGGRQRTDDPEEAGELAGAAKSTGLAELATAALEAFKGTGSVDPANVAAIGFCFGGSTVADLVKARADIVGGASFHGGLSADAAPAESGTYPPLALYHGGADPLVEPEALAGFVEACVAAGVPLTLVSYPEAKHAFTNPAADGYGMEATAYDAGAAGAAFAASDRFLDAVLGAGD